MSEYEFRDEFDLLDSSTNEYEKLKPVFEKSILPKATNREAYLDIGPGLGSTSSLSATFNHVFLVEPDPLYCLEAVGKFLAAGKLVTVFNGLWEDTNFGSQKFDLIFCAHVLYFVDPGNWAKFIHKMMSHMALGGQLVILMVAKGDEATELIGRQLQIEEVGSYPFSSAVIEILQASDESFDVISFEAALTAKTPAEMVEMMTLFPIMQYDKKSTEEQRLFLVEEQFKAGELYRMPYTVDAIVVEAPTV